MPITATCPNCSQKLQVDDQYAGKQVRCPKCGNTMTMPTSQVPTAQIVSEPPLASPINSPTEPLPAGSAGAGFLETVQRSLAAFGLDTLSTKLLYAGACCLAGMVLFTLFPWFSFSQIGFGGLQVQMGGSVLGVRYGAGIMNLLFSLAALAFLLVSLVVIKKRETFDISLWAAAGWSALASVWRLIDVANYGSVAGIGLYLTLLASLGAAGTFGYIIFQRFGKKRI